jgi:hypothetical protein
MRSAQILHWLGDDDMATPLVERMLDPTSGMRDDRTGGWRDATEPKAPTDLWASAYAADLLHEVVCGTLPVNRSARTRARPYLTETLGFLRRAWDASQWRYSDKRPSERNAAMVFAEVAPALLAHARPVANTVLAWLGRQVRADQLVQSYIAKSGLGEPAATIRLAYCFFAAREEELASWRRLAAHVCSLRTSQRPVVWETGADAAMLLHMLLHMKA